MDEKRGSRPRGAEGPTARHRRIKELFAALIELPETERAAALERECRGDPALRAEVESLLAHHRPDSILAGPMPEGGPGRSRAGAEARLGAADAPDADGGQSLEPPSTAPVPVPPVPLAGRRIGSILVERELASGGMGTVFLGYDERLHRQVALKSLRSEWHLEPGFRTRFLREARVLSRLRHPNICEIFGYEETLEGDYLVLEYIEGPSLKTTLKQPLASRERDRIAVTLAEVLQVAHGAGVVHRDLKPDNVMFTRDGRMKVLDFGIAHIATESADPSATPPEGSPCPLETHAGMLLGTPRYMAPEQARGELVTPASDIFSLGLILYELYLKRPAYPGDLPLQALLERTREGRVEPLEGLRRDRRRLVTQMLALEPSARPTATEVAQALRRIVERPRRWLRRGLVAALLLLALAGTLKYVVDIQMARASAELGRFQGESTVLVMIDEMFNKLPARDRRALLERIGQRALRNIEELPAFVQKDAVMRVGRGVRFGAHARLRVGDLDGARMAFERALRLDEEGAAATTAAEVQAVARRGLPGMGDIAEGAVDERAFIALLSRACAFYEHLLEQDADNLHWRDALASNLMGLSWIQLELGQLAEALSALERARALYGSILEQERGNLRAWQFQNAVVHLALAETRYLRGELDLALELAQASRRILEPLVAAPPRVSELLDSLGEAFAVAGRVLLAQGDRAGALEAFEAARKIHQRLFEDDPAHQRQLAHLALDELSLAEALRDQGDAPGARAALERAVAVTDTTTPDAQLIVQEMRARALLELDRVAEARPFVERLVAAGWHQHRTRGRFAALVRRHDLLVPSGDVR